MSDDKKIKGYDGFYDKGVFAELVDNSFLLEFQKKLLENATKYWKDVKEGRRKPAVIKSGKYIVTQGCVLFKNGKVYKESYEGNVNKALRESEADLEKAKQIAESQSQQVVAERYKKQARDDDKER